MQKANAYSLAEGMVRTILVVEDEMIVLEMVSSLLEDRGFRVLRATGSAEAEEIWSRDHASIDLFLTDIDIPGTSGPYLARQFKREKPNLRIIVSTGSSYIDPASEIAEILREIPLIEKPYRPQALLAEISRQLDVRSNRPKRKSGTILLVEDDDSMRNVIAELLSSAGYRILTAQNAEIAMGHWEREKSKIDLVLTDVLMPGQKGSDLVRELLQIRPDLRVLIMTGSREETVLVSVSRTRATAFLPKPFDRERLFATVSQALCA